MTTCLIGGVFYGNHNIGDEAILYSIIRTFMEERELHVLSDGSDWINEYFPHIMVHKIKNKFMPPKCGIYCSRRPLKTLPLRFLQIVFLKDQIYSKFDTYICGGATILSDCPWHSLRTVEFAGRSNKNVFLWGVGMAEGNDKRTNKYIKKVLNKDYVKRIYTRDEFVAKRLIDIGIDGSKIKISYDPAIQIEGKSFELNDYLNEEQKTLYLNGKKKICITLSGETDIAIKTPIDIIVSSVKTLQKKYDADIFLIPTGCGVHCKDIEFAKKISLQCNNSRVTAICREFKPEHLVEFLKKFSITISSRLHMNIFSASANVPSIGVVRNSKIRDFAVLLNLPYLEMIELNEEKIISCVDKVITDEQKYKDTLKNTVTIMRRQYLEASQEIIKMI